MDKKLVKRIFRVLNRKMNSLVEESNNTVYVNGREVIRLNTTTKEKRIKEMLAADSLFEVICNTPAENVLRSEAYVE